MALDKAVDSTQLNTDLTSVANAIRTKGGTSASLSFPSGFVDAIGAISTGGNTPITGTVTPASAGTQDVLFGKTINSYIAVFELTDASKTALINAGAGSNRAFFLMLYYPKPEINNKTGTSTNAYINYYNDSSDNVNAGQGSTGFTDATSTKVTIRAYDITYNSAYTFIAGYTYNYKIIPLS